MQFQLSNTLPDYPKFVEGIRRAPDRGYTLTPAQTETALKNALRYIPEELHEKLAPEFMEELVTRGRIYGYRFRPEGDLKAKPIDQYKGKCIEGKAFQVMIDNNLCFDIALYPYELVTYGETGQVCQNWMQYRLIKMYLEELTQDQTLVVESGHPLGLFKSRPEAPRVIITNAMMVGMFDNQKDWHEAMQMGVANYGQMTAGGWMYIGPQGIVHGTFNTILNAGRKKLGIAQDKDLRGYLFVSSGLGGMSGAQPKAGVIAGAASIIAEVDSSRIETRHSQGWVQHVTQDMKEAFDIAKKAMDELAERIACEVERHIDINKLLDLCTRPFPCAYSLPYTQDVPVDTVRRRFPKMQIAVARDPAFSFIYRENLDRLREMGGCLTFFSPLYSKELPKADLIYLPGGYPELFSRQLHRRKLLMKQLYDYVETGGKVLAECGGMMLLARSLTTQKGTVYEMAGALPLACTMEDAHLHLGYRCTEYRGMVLKGHEFHYSSVVSPESLPSVAALYNAKGNKVATPLYRYKNVVAGYTHWYWGETDLFRLWE